MTGIRSLAGLLLLALLSATLNTTPAVAADDVRTRTFGDAALFELASEAVQAASDHRSGSTWKDLDGATRAIIEVKIEHLKYLRRDLVREMRRDLRKHRGQEHACERAEIRRAMREKDAALEGHLKELRHVRGDHRKAFTKLTRFIQENAIKPLGKVAKQALRMSLDELALMYLSGGALNRATIRTVFRRSVVRVAREQGRTFIHRTAERALLGRRALPTTDELARICDGQSKTGAGAATVGTARSSADTFASGAWQLDECTASAQFSLESFMPAPPYSQPYTLVRFDWPNAEDVMLTYFATSGDPNAKYPSYDAAMDAGCTDEHEWNNCGPSIPLVFTEAPEALEGKANNRVVKPGTYSLVAEPKGACINETKNGEWDYTYPYPSSIAVTATVEHYRAGESAPYAVEGPFQATVPFWSDDPFALPIPGPYRRVLGTFEWDPQDKTPVASSDEAAPWDALPSPAAVP